MCITDDHPQGSNVGLYCRWAVHMKGGPDVRTRTYGVNYQYNLETSNDWQMICICLYFTSDPIP